MHTVASSCTNMSTARSHASRTKYPPHPNAQQIPSTLAPLHPHTSLITRPFWVYRHLPPSDQFSYSRATDAQSRYAYSSAHSSVEVIGNSHIYIFCIIMNIINNRHTYSWICIFHSGCSAKKLKWPNKINTKMGTCTGLCMRLQLSHGSTHF